MRGRWILLTAAGLTAVGAITWSAMASNVETPDYSVSSKSGNLEIREYGPTIVAEATVEGERDTAIRRGFGIIADYIFGNNLSSSKVAMTAPVTQQSSEKIAMTAPVTQQAKGQSWNVRFVMPAKYTMETLPKPVNPQVALIEVPATRFAAIRFSGCSVMTGVHVIQDCLIHSGILACFVLGWMRDRCLRPRAIFQPCRG